MASPANADMVDPRSARGAERSLKRKKELEELAAAGDQWAAKRLHLNESQRRREQATRDAAADGNDDARLRLQDKQQKGCSYAAKYRGKERQKLTTSHEEAVQHTRTEKATESKNASRPLQNNGASTMTTRSNGKRTDSQAVDVHSPFPKATASKDDDTPSHGPDSDSDDHESELGSPGMKLESESEHTYDTRDAPGTAERYDVASKISSSGKVGLKPHNRDAAIVGERAMGGFNSHSTDTSYQSIEGLSLPEKELMLKLRRTRLERQEIELELELLELQKKAKSDG